MKTILRAFTPNLETRLGYWTALFVAGLALAFIEVATNSLLQSVN